MNELWKSFKNLGICEPVLRSINDAKFESPSEIQEKSIPLIIAGKDVIGRVCNWFRKDACIWFRYNTEFRKRKGHSLPGSLVPFVPHKRTGRAGSKGLSKFSKLQAPGNYCCLRRRRYQSADPGIKDSGCRSWNTRKDTWPYRKEYHQTGKGKNLVLDEADRMFRICGFKDDVEKIIRKCPQERQTLLFSALSQKMLSVFRRSHMKTPLQVSVTSFVDPKKLHQTYYDVGEDMKFSLLVHLLKHEDSNLVMVFCNTKRIPIKLQKI